MKELQYKSVYKSLLKDDFLKGYIRDQKTEEVYVYDNHKLIKKKDYFEETWQEDDLKGVIQVLRYFLDQGGFVIACYDQDRVVGFSGVNGQVMGSEGQYRNLSYVHVSKPYRHQGIGRKLMKHTIMEARRRGYEKLYIGGHASVSTIDFYMSIGCQLASEIVKEVYDHEPRDIQLELEIKSLKTFVRIDEKIGDEKLPKKVFEEHMTYLNQYLEAYDLYGGGFKSCTGGMLIFKAESIEEANTFALNDPIITEGYYKANIYEWEVILKPEGSTL